MQSSETGWNSIHGALVLNLMIDTKRQLYTKITHFVIIFTGSFPKIALRAFKLGVGTIHCVSRGKEPPSQSCPALEFSLRTIGAPFMA